MDAIVLDSNFIEQEVIDVFDSIIWNDKYSSCGDFEITASPDSNFMSKISKGPYLSLKESEHTMIVEYLKIHSDVEEGNKIISKGRSIETILERRIIWTQTVLLGNFQTEIERLLNENAITPSDPDREIDNLVFEASTDPAITSLTIDNQFGPEDTLYSAISGLCFAYDIGFKLILENGNFLFSLYAGKDRSYDQLENPYVIFSPKFENMINADYTASSVRAKTVTLVAGEKGVGNGRKMVTVASSNGAGTGLNRREMFTNAEDLTKTTPDGTLTDEEYLANLTRRGQEELSQNIFSETFEGQVDTTHMYVYGEDFFMGDVVQTENEYGNEARSRIVEMIHSQDMSGIKIYPTFSSVL